MSATSIECYSCGNTYPADEGCGSCTNCPDCTPAACICQEGRELRAADLDDRCWRQAREALREMHR